MLLWFPKLVWHLNNIYGQEMTLIKTGEIDREREEEEELLIYIDRERARKRERHKQRKRERERKRDRWIEDRDK